MTKCDNCRVRKEMATGFDIHWFDEDDCPFAKCQITTNADRIRSLSDEELEKWIEQLEPNKCPCDDWFERCEKWTCNGCWLDWLKEEVKDDH